MHAIRPARFLYSCLVFLVLTPVLLTPAGCGSGPKDGSSQMSGQSAAPAITAVSPSTITAGSGAFTLTVTGTGFVQQSAVAWNGTALTTTYVSATQLTAMVPASLAASSGNAAVTVQNPGGTSSGSSSVDAVTVDNAAPTITGLSPASVPAGTGGATVTVNGTGFFPGSVAQLDGSARPTTVTSATQLSVALTAQDLATPGSAAVTVMNPAPGGGTSAAATLTVNVPGAPVLSSLSPASVLMGAPATTVTITGTGFTPATQVKSGYAPGLAVQYVSPTTLTVTLPSSLLQYAGMFDLSATGNGYASNTLSFSVLYPRPAITSLTPLTVSAGSQQFSLHIAGSGMVGSETQVLVNGVAQSASTDSAGAATVLINETAVAQPGTLNIALMNPTPGGGTSATVPLTVIPGANRIRTLNLAINAMAWNPANGYIYAAIAASSATDASSVAVIDPASGKVVTTQVMPAEPTLLAMSSDQQFLYVGIGSTGQILRLKLPGLTQDISWNAGDAQAYLKIEDLKVEPGSPHTVAVVQASTGSTQPLYDVAIYDDGKARLNVAPSADQIVWGTGNAGLYGTNTKVSGGSELTYAVNASGVSSAGEQDGILTSFASIQYDASTDRLYDSAGQVFDPATQQQVNYYSYSRGGNALSPSGPFAIDSANDRVFFASSSLNSAAGADGVLLQAFDQSHFTQLGTMLLPENSERPTLLIRWGATGLALESANVLSLVDGPFVSGSGQATAAAGGYGVTAPVLQTITPQTVPVGSGDTVLTLTGSNFTTATTVEWNNQTFDTTLVNPDTVQVTIPAAMLSTASASGLYTVNGPRTTTSAALPFAVLPDLGNGLSFAALGISGDALAWDAAHSLLYETPSLDDPVLASTLVAINPAKATISSLTPLVNGSDLLALADDDTYLYTASPVLGQVQRFKLPAITLNLQYATLNDAVDPPPADFGPQTCSAPSAIAVAPGAAQTLAVSEQQLGIVCGGVVVYDNATPRPDVLLSTDYQTFFQQLSWGAKDTVLYGFALGNSDPVYIDAIGVSSAGVADGSMFTEGGLGNVQFNATTGLLYANTGAVLRPSDGAVIGNFNASGLMTTDAALDRAYFVGSVGDTWTLQIYDLSRYTLLDSIPLPTLLGYPMQVVRWGTQGLAVAMRYGGMTYLISGPELTGAAPARMTPGAQLEHVHLPTPPAAAH